ncbi:hypothetical protein ABBQ38_013488 [Trebouxia sp. C0009 RCD-2024]
MATEVGTEAGTGRGVATVEMSVLHHVGGGVPAMTGEGAVAPAPTGQLTGAGGAPPLPLGVGPAALLHDVAAAPLLSDALTGDVTDQRAQQVAGHCLLFARAPQPVAGPETGMPEAVHLPCVGAFLNAAAGPISGCPLHIDVKYPDK